jgi:hypothetical protein
MQRHRHAEMRPGGDKPEKSDHDEDKVVDNATRLPKLDRIGEALSPRVRWQFATAL